MPSPTWILCKRCLYSWDEAALRRPHADRCPHCKTDGTVEEGEMTPTLRRYCQRCGHQWNPGHSGDSLCEKCSTPHGAIPTWAKPPEEEVAAEVLGLRSVCRQMYLRGYKHGRRSLRPAPDETFAELIGEGANNE